MNNVSELLIATLMMLFSLSVPSYACYDDDEDDCYIYCEDRGYTEDDEDEDEEDEEDDEEEDDNDDWKKDLILILDEYGHCTSLICWDEENDNIVIIKLQKSADNQTEENLSTELISPEDFDSDWESEFFKTWTPEDFLYSDFADTTQVDNMRIYSVRQEIEWTKDVTSEIRIALEKLQKEDKIKDYPNIKTCHYDPKTKCIQVPKDCDFTTPSLTHEIIHLKQHELGMLDENFCNHASDNEYQAYVVNFILMKAYGEIVEGPEGAKDSQEWKVFSQNIKEHMGKDQKSGELWYDANLLTKIEAVNHDELSNMFREYYKQADNDRKAKGLPAENRVYYMYHDSNYEWNWAELFKNVGLKMR